MLLEQCSQGRGWGLTTPPPPLLSAAQCVLLRRSLGLLHKNLLAHLDRLEGGKTIHTAPPPAQGPRGAGRLCPLAPVQTRRWWSWQ